VSNSTIERISVLLQARPRGMLMLCDELAGLFLNLSRYSGGTDRPFWLECWNGGHYVVERMGRPALAIDHLLVGLTGGVQPRQLGRSVPGGGGGPYSPKLFCRPRKAHHHARIHSPEAMQPG